VELVKGPNIVSLPELDELPEQLCLPVVLKVGDDLSTDEILPAGAAVLPLRSNVPAIAEFAFAGVDPDYPRRAREAGSGHAVVGGSNYGQGSSREHAALAPRYLGLRVVLAKSFARIHWQNLVNFGVLPLTFADAGDYDRVGDGDRLHLDDLPACLRDGNKIEVRCGERTLEAEHRLSPRQVDVLASGGLIRRMRQELLV
jgi:aconitate hydratase